MSSVVGQQLVHDIHLQVRVQWQQPQLLIILIVVVLVLLLQIQQQIVLGMLALPHPVLTPRAHARSQSCFQLSLLMQEAGLQNSVDHFNVVARQVL